MSENLIVAMDIASVKPDPNQPRKNFPAKEIEKMARSISAVGQKVPVIVYPNGDGVSYFLKDGQMRWQSIQKLGKKTINCVVEDPPEDANHNFIEQSVINDVRFGMGIVDTARAYQKMLDEGASLYIVAEAHGKTEKSVEKDISLLNLPTKCHQALDNGTLTKAVAYRLAEMSHEFPSTGKGSIEEAYEKSRTAKDVSSAIKKLESWARKQKEEDSPAESAKKNSSHADRKTAGQALNRFLTSCNTMLEKLEDSEFMMNACMGMKAKDSEKYMELLNETVEVSMKCSKLIKDGIETYVAK